MAHEDDFPFDLESLLASIAEMLKQKGDTQGVAILASSEASVELLERDNWNGGTYSWGLVFVLDLESFHRLDSRGVRDSAENDIQTVATKLFLNYENHTLYRVTIVPRVTSVEGWRDNAKSYVSKAVPLPSSATSNSPGGYSPRKPSQPTTSPTGTTTALTQRRADPAFMNYDFHAVSTAPEKTTMSEAKPMKIFLSHKGADKALVRRYFETLKLLGFDPWLDEDAMAAGVVLQRGIHDGFEQSCAVVFFVTPNFKDEGFLETEIDHALTQLQDKGKDKFRIITLAFKQGEKKGAVPKILKTYVYKEPVDGLEGLRDILKALPIKVGPVTW